MAWHNSTNQTPATSAVGVYNLIAQLIAAGWTKPKDSDGTTYSSSGAQVTGGGSGTHGLGNSNAWVVMNAPAGGRAVTFQRGSNNQNWRVKYSPVNGFVTGSPAAAVTPSATDEVILTGGGTDASPTFTQWFSGTEGSMRFNSRTNDTSPYCWWMASWPVGGGSPTGGAFYDGIINGPISVDNDPHVIAIDTSGATFASGVLGAASYTYANQPTNNTMASHTGITFPFAAPSNGVSPDAANGKDMLRPLEFYRNGGFYYKGQSANIFWEMTGTGTSPRNLASTLTIVTTSDYIIVGTAALPWDGSSPLV